MSESTANKENLIVPLEPSQGVKELLETRALLKEDIDNLFRYQVDKSMPADQLRFVQNGKVIRTVVNIGTEEQEKRGNEQIPTT